jgi:hypothetical protein
MLGQMTKAKEGWHEERRSLFLFLTQTCVRPAMTKIDLGHSLTGAEIGSQYLKLGDSLQHSAGSHAIWDGPGTLLHPKALIGSKRK